MEPLCYFFSKQQSSSIQTCHWSYKEFYFSAQICKYSHWDPTMEQEKIYCSSIFVLSDYSNQMWNFSLLHKKFYRLVCWQLLNLLLAFIIFLAIFLSNKQKNVLPWFCIHWQFNFLIYLLVVQEFIRIWNIFFVKDYSSQALMCRNSFSN